MFGSFDIKDNLNISGSIPSELGKLSSLQYLNIGKIGVDDDRVNFFSYCVVVSQFELWWFRMDVSGNNALDGQLSSELGELKSLESLVLDNNTLTGSIPTQFGKLTQLKSIDLGRRKLKQFILFIMSILWKSVFGLISFMLLVFVCLQKGAIN